MSRLVGFETVAVGDLFSKIDKHQSTWEVVELVTPTGHYPHARLACVDRPTDRRMIAIAALNDKRMYLDAGKSPRFEGDDLPIDEPHVDMPAAKLAQQMEPPKAETKADVQPQKPAPKKAARTAAPPEPAKEQVEAAPVPRRKSSMRAVFDQLEQDPQAA